MKETAEEFRERQYQKTLAYNRKVQGLKPAREKWYGPSKSVPVGVYLLRCGDFPYYKIGITGDIEQRMSGIQPCCPFPITCVVYMEKVDRRAALAKESELHRKYDDCSMNGEWFELSESQAKNVVREIVA